MSKRKIEINPKYEHLREFIENLPEIFEQEGVAIYGGRNLIKVFDVEGFRLNVKRYCVPRFILNRFVYQLLRKPKAVRAYNYAFRLLEYQIDTPESIAYILERGIFTLGYSYFISVQGDYAHDIGDYMRDVNSAFKSDGALTSEDISVLRAFGRYTAKIHDMNIYHKDYGDGNVLFNIVDGEPKFTLLDINRMDFAPVSMEKGCANFNRMKFDGEVFQIVADAYAEARGFSKLEVLSAIIKSRLKFINRRKFKLFKRKRKDNRKL